MASIFKRTRDKKKKHAAWYVSYTDHRGKRRTKKGFTDKSLTEQLAAKLESDARMRKTGLIDPDQEAAAESRRSELETHLKAFEQVLERRKNTPKHVKLTMGRIRRVIDGCKFKTLGDLRTEKVETFLGKIQQDDDLGHRTYNHYVQAIEQFGIWLVDSRKLPSNPVVGLTRLNNEVDVRRNRRALTQDEFKRLVQSARESDTSIQCYDGETRAKIYILSYMTGLRRGELASLTPANFDLASQPATVTIPATISKHRKKDVLPLHPDLVTFLHVWLKDLQSCEVLFPHLAKRRTWLMVKKDLERVGIAYETPEGVADFHAAGRHTHITELLRNGSSLPEARMLARHADINMTMKYTHIGIQDQAKALKGLPSSWQRIGSDSDDFQEQPKSSDGNGRRTLGQKRSDVSPGDTSSSDNKKQKEASDDSDASRWRRRGFCWQNHACRKC
ncbi:tyrosine-type recombinase/integrase [Bremerella alba]|uniref:Tyrosine recombinase XerC n=1 Tax=Bremerella alba TaxID=980252 RepID=A0A7V8V359_9BACT|nr:site-specific integrase [Bremerella alba]MBA2114093.1 Tyrosine recombinase XerC [Bremerella alba]